MKTVETLQQWTDTEIGNINVNTVASKFFIMFNIDKN